MMRRLLPPLVLTALASLWLAGCSDSEPLPGSGSKQEPVIWRFALEEIGGSVQDAYAQEFRTRIREASDGLIRVEIYPYGSIGTSPQLTQLVQDKRVHLAFASPGHLAGVIPEAGVFSLHFLLPDDDDAVDQRLSDPDLLAMLSATYEEEGLQLLDVINEGWMTWTAGKPLAQPEDFEGLRMRTMMSPILLDIYRAYGAEPVPMPYSEVYSALQLNQIDGQTNPAFAVLEMKFHELQSDMTLPRASRFISTVISSHQWYQELPEDQRHWLDAVLATMGPFIQQTQQTINRERLDKLQESGRITVTELTEEQRDRFRELSLPLRQTYVEQTGPSGQQLLEQLLRDDATPAPASSE